MNTTKLLRFTLFISFCGLFCIGSLPVFGQHFRVTLSGFRVNKQTDEGLRAKDGVNDEVRLLSFVGTLDSAGIYGYGRKESPVMRGISFDPNNRQTISTSIDLFDDIIGQNTRAVLIIPSIWEWDDENDLRFFSSYENDIIGLPSRNGTIGRELAAVVRSRPPLLLSKFLLSGTTLGINSSSMKLAGGYPQDRPIGMHTIGLNQFGFTPQGLILTPEFAALVARTDIANEGVGIVPVRYVEASGMGGDYTLLLKVEQMPVCPTDLSSNFTGRSVITVNIPGQQPIVFTPPVILPVRFTNCRRTLQTATFPTFTTEPFQIPGLGPNRTTVTQTGGGTGTFDTDSGELQIPIELNFAHELKIGDSTIVMRLRGQESSGNITLEGEAPFSDGYLGTTGSRMIVRITGSFSPRLR